MKANLHSSKAKKITKILIANRGEIACRIITTAKRMGIETVAVYSDADQNAKHVEMADSSIYIGKSPALESYLNIEAIFKAVNFSKADAIHPGYGFLSENSDFAKRCADENVIFIGPSSDAIFAMGIKDEAKAIMEKAGVPILPGYQGTDQTITTLKKAALQIGLPIIIKAVAGGGGKGMRIVNDEKDLEESLLSAKRESKSAFGNDTLMLEKYLSDARHIEVQVFADTLGNIVHLFERDCSIQRRYQKIIEEAPAFNIPDTIKTKLYETAVNACRAIQYYGAGTLEFLYQDKQFYFMEMNTRLQVEHPVTEGITGLDLVEWQIRVAMGERLPLLQDDIKASNHAIELRIYAEDPEHGFIPATGIIQKFYHPKTLDPLTSLNYRIDTGVREKDEVGVYYDPMIAKLIVVEKDREMALSKLHEILYKTEIVGFKTNLSLLRHICDEKDYKKGNFSTRYLDYHPELLHTNNATHIHLNLLSAFLYRYLCDQCNAQITSKEILEPFSPWYQVTGWQVNSVSKVIYFYWLYNEKLDAKNDIRDKNIQHTIEMTLTDPKTQTYTVFLSHDKSLHTIQGLKKQTDNQLCFNLQANNHHTFVSHQALVTPLHFGLHVYLSEFGVGTDILFPERIKENIHHQGDSALVSPLPGIITHVLVKSGEKVFKGQKLLIMEAMKMEHTILAPSNGLIKQVLYRQGDQIQDNVSLFDFEAESKEKNQT